MRRSEGEYNLKNLVKIPQKVFQIKLLCKFLAKTETCAAVTL